ncbi:hypothetical protein J6590_019688 [Homalodisca vitripennis]|nr:hypothetical protein J6590_019688 [Homalodisca vitripennis]
MLLKRGSHLEDLFREKNNTENVGLLKPIEPPSPESHQLKQLNRLRDRSSLKLTVIMAYNSYQPSSVYQASNPISKCTNLRLNRTEKQPLKTFDIAGSKTYSSIACPLALPGLKVYRHGLRLGRYRVLTKHYTSVFLDTVYANFKTPLHKLFNTRRFQV